MAQQLKFCPECGAQLNPGAKFCSSCGQKLDVFTSDQSKQQENKTQSRTNSVQSKKIVDTVQSQHISYASTNVNAGIGQAANCAAQILKLGDFTAPNVAGEWEFIDMSPVQGAGEVISGVSGTASEMIESITSPVDTIFKSILSFAGGIFGTLIKPKRLIFALILGAIWIFCGLNRNSGDPVATFLSFLTFGEGGFDREGLGTVFGLLGKGSVAVMLASIFSGGIPNTFKGISGIFNKTESKKSIVLLLVGIIAGGIGYLAYVGLDNISVLTSMAGISGAVLALQAIGQGNGWIYRIAQSLTASKKDGIRSAQDGKINSLLGGLAMGFAVVTLAGSVLGASPDSFYQVEETGSGTEWANITTAHTANEVPNDMTDQNTVDQITSDQMTANQNDAGIAEDYSQTASGYMTPSISAPDQDVVIQDFDWFFNEEFPEDGTVYKELWGLGGMWKSMLYVNDESGNMLRMVLSDTDVQYMGYKLTVLFHTKARYEVTETSGNLLDMVDCSQETFSMEGDWDEERTSMDISSSNSTLNLKINTFVTKDGFDYAIGSVYDDDYEIGKVVMIRATP